MYPFNSFDTFHSIWWICGSIPLKMIDAMNMICYAISHVKDVYIYWNDNSAFQWQAMCVTSRQWMKNPRNDWMCVWQRERKREKEIEGVREVSFDNQHDVVINCLLSRATSCTDENVDIIPMKRNLIICEICILFYWNSIIWSNFRRMNEFFSQISKKTR